MNFQTINVEEYRYEKVKKSDVKISIPTEPIYYEYFNHRVIVGIFPEFDSREEYKDNIILLNIVKISETDQIVRATLYVSDIESVISTIGMKKSMTAEEALREDVVTYLKRGASDNVSSREYFVAKFVRFTERINKFLAQK